LLPQVRRYGEELRQIKGEYSFLSPWWLIAWARKERIAELTPSHVACAVFAAVFFPLLTYFAGWGGLIKYWLLPLLLMHWQNGSFSNNIDEKPTHVYERFFPELATLSEMAYSQAQGAYKAATRGLPEQQPPPLRLDAIPVYKMRVVAQCLRLHHDAVVVEVRPHGWILSSLKA